MSDPTSVNTTYIQTLLENLRNSQTWVAAVGSSNSDASDVPVPEQYPTGLDTTPSFPEDRGHDSGADDRNKSSVPALGSSERPSVASLLSQLQASPISSLLSPVANPISTSADSQLHTLPESSAAPAGPLSTQSPAVASSHRQKDFRAFTFQQALLHLGELGKEKSFIEAINSMKAEQDDLERKLWEERQEIIHRHEKKVNGAKAKAQIVGVGLSKHDAEMLSNSIQRELQAFDIERVLPAWDGLTSKHQAAMEVLTVPSMFITSQASDLQKQQKIIQVLENIAMGGT